MGDSERRWERLEDDGRWETIVNSYWFSYRDKLNAEINSSPGHLLHVLNNVSLKRIRLFIVGLIELFLPALLVFSYHSVGLAHCHLTHNINSRLQLMASAEGTVNHF